MTTDNFGLVSSISVLEEMPRQHQGDPFASPLPPPHAALIVVAQTPPT